MNTLHPNKTRSQVSVAVNSGFFWSDNKEIEFEKKTIVNGLPIIERHKGIILYPTPDHEDKPLRNLTKTWKMVPGFKLLSERREIKPIGKLILLKKELTVEQTSNYLKSLKI